MEVGIIRLGYRLPAEFALSRSRVDTIAIRRDALLNVTRQQVYR
jgi:hypothetical protein